MKALNSTQYRRLDLDVAACLDFIGAARHVLYVGAARDGLLQALDARGFDTSCLLVGGSDLELGEALSAAVTVVPEVPGVLPEPLQHARYDAVIVDPCVVASERAGSLLAQLRKNLQDGGALIAVVASGQPVASPGGAVAGRKTKIYVPNVQWAASSPQIPTERETFSPGSVSRAVEAAQSGSLRLSLIALNESAHWAGGIEHRVQRLAAYRKHLEDNLSEERADAAELRREVVLLKRAAEKGLADHTAVSNKADRLQSALETERAARAALESALGLAREALADAAEHAGRLERDTRAVLAEADTLSAKCTRLENALSERQSTTVQLHRDLERERSASTQAAMRAEDAERRVAYLERSLLEFKVQIAQGSEYVSNLLAQISQKDGQIAEGTQYARALEADVAELEAVRSAALSERLVMREYIDSLREQLAELPRLREAYEHLVAQSEDLISAVRAESAELSGLIDLVQASHFWKAKRWVSRLRARLNRR